MILFKHMGLFTEAKCIICGENAAALSRKKLNNGFYICGDCIERANITPGYTLATLKNSSEKEIKERILSAQKAEAENDYRLENFKPSTKIGNMIWFDDSHRWFVLPQGTFRANIDDCIFFEYAELVDFEVQEDGSTITKGGLGKALVGGAVFGIAGAIAGATSKRTQSTCTSLRVKITTRNRDYPINYITLINSEINKSSLTYRGMTDRVQEIISKLQIIVSEIENEKRTSRDHYGGPDNLAIDQIKKYKELLDMGAITKQEYELKKKKLLNL